MPNIKGLCLLVSDKKILKRCIYLCKTSGPLGGTIFGPGGYIFNYFGRGLLDKAVCEIQKGLGRLGLDENIWIQKRTFLRFLPR